MYCQRRSCNLDNHRVKHGKWQKIHIERDDSKKFEMLESGTYNHGKKNDVWNYWNTKGEKKCTDIHSNEKFDFHNYYSFKEDMRSKIFYRQIFVFPGYLNGNYRVESEGSVIDTSFGNNCEENQSGIKYDQWTYYNEKGNIIEKGYYNSVGNKYGVWEYWEYGANHAKNTKKIH